METPQKAIKAIVVSGGRGCYHLGTAEAVRRLGGYIHAVECRPSEEPLFKDLQPKEFHNIIFGANPSRYFVDESIDLVIVAIPPDHGITTVDELLPVLLNTYPNAKIICEKCSVPTSYPDTKRVFGHYEWTHHEQLLAYIKEISASGIKNMTFICGPEYSGTSEEVIFNKISDLFSVLFINNFYTNVVRVIQTEKATSSYACFSITLEDGWKNHQHVNMNVFVKPTQLGIKRIGSHVIEDNATRMLVNDRVFYYDVDILNKALIGSVMNYPKDCSSFLQKNVTAAVTSVRDTLVMWQGGCVL